MARGSAQISIKRLYADSAGICALPDCKKRIFLKKFSGETTHIGEIAHIYAYSPSGPRAKEKSGKHQDNEYENLILLCPTCHTIVDKQPLIYTSEKLKQIKNEHETWVINTLNQEISKVTFAELEVASKAIAQGRYAESSVNFILITPDDKIKKNSLTEKSRALITMGLTRSIEVEKYITEMAKLDYNFPQALKSGFIEKYEESKKTNQGDDLFMDMYSYVSSNQKDLCVIAAGLAILVHMFQLCEIFEK